MPILTLDNSTFYFERWGSGDRPTLLCLHGGGCRGDHFAQLAPRFADERQVIALDQRGHGGNVGALGPFDPTTLAADAAAVVNALGLSRIVVVGHSLGGPVALRLLERADVDVCAVVSLDSPLVLPGPMADGLGQICQAFEGEHGTEFFRSFMAPMVGFEDDAKKATEFLDSLCHVPAAAMANLVAHVRVFEANDTLVAQRSVPILHIDTGLGVCDLARLRELRPDAWIGGVVGTGHYPHVESPDQVAAMIRHFLLRHEA